MMYRMLAGSGHCGGDSAPDTAAGRGAGASHCRSILALGGREDGCILPAGLVQLMTSMTLVRHRGWVW